MNALELADFYEPQSSQVAAMLRAQHAAIRQLREALSVLVESGGLGPEQMFDDARAALAATETLI